jgi:hypothetical protein
VCRVWMVRTENKINDGKEENVKNVSGSEGEMSVWIIGFTVIDVPLKLEIGESAMV